MARLQVAVKVEVKREREGDKEREVPQPRGRLARHKAGPVVNKVVSVSLVPGLGQDDSLADTSKRGTRGDTGQFKIDVDGCAVGGVDALRDPGDQGACRVHPITSMSVENRHSATDVVLVASVGCVVGYPLKVSAGAVEARTLGRSLGLFFRGRSPASWASSQKT